MTFTHVISKRLPAVGALLFLFLLTPRTAADETNTLKILEVRKIWDAAPHNAFTDLIRFNDKWFCTFREGARHVSPDGKLRVLQSTDGQEWTSAALISDSRGDLRDSKLSITPKNELMLIGAVALPQPGPVKHQTLVWFSSNGTDWSEPTMVGEDNFWLWRVTWHGAKCYGVGYATAGPKIARLYGSDDGKTFRVLVPELFSKELYGKDYPNESSIIFLEDGTALCLLRRDADTSTAQLGRAKPPYKEWTWLDLGRNLGGPHMLQIPDGRILAAGRLYDKKVRTSLCWLDPDKGTLEEALTFPSGGDTSYPGLVWHDNTLWMTYYSSHEGKTSIYLAKIIIPADAPPSRSF